MCFVKEARGSFFMVQAPGVASLSAHLLMAVSSHSPICLARGAGLLQTTIRQAPQAGFRSDQGYTILSLSRDL